MFESNAKIVKGSSFPPSVSELSADHEGLFGLFHYFVESLQSAVGLGKEVQSVALARAIPELPADRQCLLEDLDSFTEPAHLTVDDLTEVMKGITFTPAVPDLTADRQCPLKKVDSFFE